MARLYGPVVRIFPKHATKRLSATGGEEFLRSSDNGLRLSGARVQVLCRHQNVERSNESVAAL